MSNIEVLLEKQQQKLINRKNKAARRKLQKALKCIEINSYKKAVKSGKYGEMRNDLISQIINFPRKALRMNLMGFKFLKEHKNLGYSC